ncbi:MAG: hypothetical protein IT370_31525, partial [Deltaproteobacteria bacterium]|nr:hypothetical protein [Deltaproteobacteria bacterium]
MPVPRTDCPDPDGPGGESVMCGYDCEPIPDCDPGDPRNRGECELPFQPSGSCDPSGGGALCNPQNPNDPNSSPSAGLGAYGVNPRPPRGMDCTLIMPG